MTESNNAHKAEPRRIQLHRFRGYNLQDHSREVNGLQAVNCARPSKWGNPHKVGWCPECGASHTRDEAIAEFSAEVDNLENREKIVDGLRGKNLACFCKPSEACHCDVLLRIANAALAALTVPANTQSELLPKGAGRVNCGARI